MLDLVALLVGFWSPSMSSCRDICVVVTEWFSLSLSNDE